MFSRFAQSPGARAAVALLGAVSAAACVKRLPPAPVPQPIAPAVDANAPLEPGHGRLVVDVVEGPSPVHRVTMQAQQMDYGQGRVSYRLYESSQLLCEQTPCVVDVPAGNVLLGFPVIGKRSLEVELVHVSPEPTAYRRSLSYFQNDRGTLTTVGIVGTSVGAAAAITGIALLPIGLDDDNDDLTTAGALSLGLGAAVMTIGIWMLRHDAATYRPGSAIHFDL